MRTTLDVDDRVLRAARALADQTGMSLGRAVSELALRGLTVGDAPASDFPLIPRAPEGHRITTGLVAEHRDDIP
jgi:hypothetical protein